MKHVKSLSSVKPMQAQEAAWWTAGNFVKWWPGPVLSFLANTGGTANDAFGWLGNIINDYLQG